MKKLIQTLVFVLIVVVANFIVASPILAEEGDAPVVENASQEADSGSTNTDTNKDANDAEDPNDTGDTEGDAEGNPMSFTATSELVVENLPPVADAGADQEITLPTDSAILDGSGSTDHGEIVAYKWVYVSGPSHTNLEIESQTTTVNNLVPGTYVFLLAVMDNDHNVDHDEVSVKIIPDPAGPNLPPKAEADAWENRTIVLPTNSVSINDKDTSYDLDGTIVSYVWTQNAGPTTIDPEDIKNPTVSDLVEGTYVFILTVTDDDGATDWDHVEIEVKPEGTNAYCEDGATLTHAEFIWAHTFGKIIYDQSIQTEDDATEYTWTVTNNTGCIVPLSLSAYRVYTWDKENNLPTQVWIDEDNSNNADSTVSLTISLPSPACVVQIDGWFGLDAPNELGSDNSKWGDPAKGPPTVAAYGYGHDEDWTLCVDDDNGGESDNSSRSRGGSRRTPQGEVLGVQAPEPVIIPAVLGLPTTGGGDSEMYIFILVLSGLITATGLIYLIEPRKLATLALASAFISLGFSATNIVFAEPEITALDCNQVTLGDLSGSVDGANATLTVPAGACPVKVSFSSYEHEGTLTPFENQILKDNITDTYGPGTHNIGELDLACNWQTDLYMGEVQEHLIKDVGHTDLIDFDYVENQDCTPENLPPTVDAGPDQTITLPSNSVNLNGTASDSDGEIVSYVWTQISGPSDINPEDIEDPTASPLVEGVYVFKLLVTDNDGAVADGHVTITVNLATEEHAATISITKIVCPAEADLPNMSGGADITSSTAVDFIASHPQCHLQQDWNFAVKYWGEDEAATLENPEQAPWESIPGSTNAHGVLTTTFNTDNVWHFWIKEVEKTGYIPFNANGISAEMYCANDVLNYDNLEKVDGPFTTGSIFHCVAFNVPVVVDHPQCSDGVDNADPEDTLIDAADPGCHSDGNASNTASYIPTDNDETNSGGNNDTQCSDNVDNNDPEDTLIDEQDPGCHTDGDATDGDDTYNANDNDETNNSAGNTECSDNIDNNDEEDELADEADPGCHTDGNANDGDDSYNPNDDDESNVEESSGGGGGGGSSRPQCSDNKDNSDREDTLVDEDDPGCHTDGNANNPDSYVRRDRSEANTVGEVLGEETSCGIYVEKYLRIGYDNNVQDVVKVQNFLNMYMNAGLKVDGIYGPKTEAAVRNFQIARAENVLAPWSIAEATGIFYLTTQTEVNNIMCPDLGLDIPSPLINWSINGGVDKPAPMPGSVYGATIYSPVDYYPGK
jgi:hypothetical protein